MFSRFKSKIFTPLENPSIYVEDGGKRKSQFLIEDKGKALPFLTGFILLIIIFFLAILFSHQYVLKKIGYFLIYEQKPQKADLIVVLNGRDAERSLAAVDLYNQGYAGLIIMAGLVKQPGSDEFWKRVGGNFNGKVFFQRAIEAMGIPEKSFQFIGNGVTSTYDEAIATRQFLKENGYKSILIVTSKWHSRRAYLTFKSVIKDDGIKVWIYPSKYDTFDPNAWWKSENNIELIVDEYIRFIYYIVSFRISPFEIIN
jgi:uncharacterized SAM-binding protein YcdF (DUF218 family)